MPVWRTGHVPLADSSAVLPGHTYRPEAAPWAVVSYVHRGGTAVAGVHIEPPASALPGARIHGRAVPNLPLVPSA